MKGYIYVLFNDNGNYIGSTFNIERRMREHKSNKNTILSSFIITKSKFNYQIIEEIEIHDKIELHQWEQYYMDKWDCVNKQNSFICF